MKNNIKTKKQDSKMNLIKTTAIETNPGLITEINLEEEQPSKYSALNRVDFNMNILDSWTEIRTKAQPKRRAYHLSFMYKSYFYVIGGIDIMTGRLSDIKRINIESSDFKWEDVVFEENNLEPLAYGAGCLLDSNYFIIGGQNHLLETKNTIYRFEIENNKLEIIPLKVTEFPPIENHSALLYTLLNQNKNEKSIIIFGGFSFKMHTNHVYSLQWENNILKCKKLFPNINDNNLNCPIPRINHSAGILNDTMWIFGGEGKEGFYLNDMWIFNLKSLIWTNVRFTKTDIPLGRTGHTMTLHNNEFYIFGGKTGNYNETNELWKFNITNQTEGYFTLLHDTLIEQYSAKEISEIQQPKNLESNELKKTFKLLTKRDMPALNPINLNKKKDVKKIKKEVLARAIQLQEFKSACEKELLKTSSAGKMKKTIVYNLDSELNLIANKFQTILQTKRVKTIFESDLIPGSLPLPRDGHSAVLYGQSMYIFGGDRNKFPFNDLFKFNLNY